MNSPSETSFSFEAESRLQDREWKRYGHGTATLRTKDRDLWIEETGQWSDVEKTSTLQGALFEKRLVYRKGNEGQLNLLKPDPQGDLQLLLTVFPEHNGKRWRSHDPHVCAQDLYSATLELTEDSELRVTWSAIGPNKDYTTISRYQNAELFRAWVSD